MNKSDKKYTPGPNCEASKDIVCSMCDEPCGYYLNIKKIFDDENNRVLQVLTKAEAK